MILCQIIGYMVSLQKSYNRIEQERVKKRGMIIMLAIFGAVMGILAYAALLDVMKSAKGLGL